MMEKIRIVVADDNDIIRQMIVDSLEEDEQIEVVGIASDGEGAIKIIKDKHPDIVLLDLVMPKQDGLSVMEVIDADKDYPETKPQYVIISAAGSEEIVNQALQAGATYYIMKPFDGEALVKRIKRLSGANTRSVSNIVYERGAKELDLEEVTVNLLRDIGVPLRMVGYKYLKDAILIALKDPDALMSITKNVYPEIASRHETSSGNVERNIRYVIESTWNRRLDKKYEKVVETVFKDVNKKPTNSEFILICSEMIHFQMK